MNEEGCEFCRGEFPLLDSGHRIEAWIEDGILYVYDKVSMVTEKIYMQHCPVCGARIGRNWGDEL